MDIISFFSRQANKRVWICGYCRSAMGAHRSFFCKRNLAKAWAGSHRTEDGWRTPQARAVEAKYMLEAFFHQLRNGRSLQKEGVNRGGGMTVKRSFMLRKAESFWPCRLRRIP